MRAPSFEALAHLRERDSNSGAGSVHAFYLVSAPLCFSISM